MEQALVSTVNMKALTKLSYIHQKLCIEENFFKWIDESVLLYAAKHKIFSSQIEAEPGKHLDLLADWLSEVNNISTNRLDLNDLGVN